MSAMAEEVAFSDGPRKHNRMTCSNESRHDQSIWNDAISRSGLDSEQIFMAIKKLLRCTVCLEYHTEANQCKNGHLICRQCTHQLERGLQQETNRGTCPTCRITLFPGISRCLLATQLSAELPTPCLFCNLYFRQSELERHETSLCLMRPVKCKYNIFGCLWKGKANEAPRHERNCSVSKRSVRDVEAIIQEKFYQRSKRSNDSSNSWHEIVNLFKERPLGVFVCVREATLHQVMRENRRNEFRFQCTTGQLSQTGQFNATIELTINLDELKFYYRTKLHSGFTELVKFRLLTIHGYDLDIPTADRLRAPKSKHSHEWQKFHCHFNVCDSKLMALANKFTELATENGADFALRLEFLVIFENVHAVRMSRGDYHGWNVVIPASPTESQINEDTSEAPAQEDSTRLNNNGHHEEDDEDEDNITPPPVVNNNRGQMEGTWDSTPDELNIPPEIAEGYRIFIDEVTEGVVVAMNEAANRELQREDVARVLRFEELPPSISMRNNNALGRSENEANDLLILGELEAEKVGDESKPVSENESEVTNDDDDDDEGSPRNCSNVGIHASDKSPRVVRSEAHIKAISSDKHSQRIAWKSKTTTTKRFGQTFDRLAPYLTRGHMWQNFEAMKCKMKRNRNVKRNSKVFKRRKVTKPRKRISKDILPATPGLAGHMVTLLTPITSYWKTMKRISVDLLEKGHQMLKSLRTSNRETDSQNLMEMPTLSRRTATAEWIAQPIGDGMIARSGGDTPGWLFN
uniref:Zinc finger RING type n=1 Tax=Echinococcus granulosus TaxID=6210 RepID=A0A068WCD2_ECHGR|nr:Zinc finger RING type [Echinococcus granulosus]